MMVAPHAGAWVETALVTNGHPSVRGSRPMRARGLKHSEPDQEAGTRRSRPMRARGLKHDKLCDLQATPQVAPHAGAWVET